MSYLFPRMITVRRLAASVGTPALTLALALSLAACGEDTGGSGAGLESVEVGGDFNKSVKVTGNGEMSVDELQEETVIEGDGPTVGDGDTALVKFWIGNGYTQKQAFSSFGKDGKAESITLGKDVSTGIREAIVDHTVGSRVAVAAPPADAFGEDGNPQLGIGNADPVLFVVDIVSSVLTAPEGTQKDVPGDIPTIKGGDTPTGFDFSKAPKKPSSELQVVTVVEGTGPKLEKGQTLTMNYLGQTYRGEVFDQTYDKGQPASFQIGVGSLIDGWDEGLVGVPIGSRVILVIPPDKGYGEQGSGDKIPGNATLVFVVDLLAAA